MNKNLGFRFFWVLVFFACLSFFIFISFFKKMGNDNFLQKNIVLFVPGIILGSPSYRELYDSVLEFVSSSNKIIYLKVFEAGFEQNEWEGLLDRLLSSKKYDFLITMNSAMQYLIEKVSSKYKDTKFLLFDSFVKNNNTQIYSLSYNVAEKAYILGYYVGLFMKENGFQRSNVALIAGQKYPVMSDYIKPYFERGIHEVVKSEVLFRILGNWYDSNKAKSISDSLVEHSKVKVILPIIGPAIEGVISSTSNSKNNAYVILFDSENYLILKKDNIIGSVISNQKFYVTKVLKDALDNKLIYGAYSVVGIKDNGISFNFKNKFYLKNTSISLKNMLKYKIKDISLNGILINKI